MKVYVVSGLGADYLVLEKLRFNPGIQVQFLPWKIPEPSESFEAYVNRMGEDIDASEPFYLLGYSFGGIIVQEIHKRKKAEKVVILGSIKSHNEKSRLIRAGKYSRLPKLIPVSFFTEKNLERYGIVRRLFDPKNPRVLSYFRVRDAHYLKWSLQQIANWECEACAEVIQIMGDKDRVFPIKNSRPDFVVKNGTHLFPATKHREVSDILAKILV